VLSHLNAPAYSFWQDPGSPAAVLTGWPAAFHSSLLAGEKAFQKSFTFGLHSRSKKDVAACKACARRDLQLNSEHDSEVFLP